MADRKELSIIRSHFSAAQPLFNEKTPVPTMGQEPTPAIPPNLTFSRPLASRTIMRVRLDNGSDSRQDLLSVAVVQLALRRPFVGACLFSFHLRELSERPFAAEYYSSSSVFCYEIISILNAPRVLSRRPRKKMTGSDCRTRLPDPPRPAFAS